MYGSVQRKIRFTDVVKTVTEKCMEAVSPYKMYLRGRGWSRWTCRRPASEHLYSSGSQRVRAEGNIEIYERDMAVY